MSLEFYALLFQTPGTIMIAYAALSVHHRVLHEHKIDNDVFRSMRKEQHTGKIGVLMVIIGFVLELVYHLA